MDKSSVLIVYTGGTIGMIEDPQSGSLQPFNFDHLTEQVPELSKFDLQLDTHAFEEPLDSSNVGPKVWKRLLEIVSDNYATYDGFVILHGSDTMAYSASALSFMIGGLSKPIIFTGSQLPIGTIRTDGKENLITAIEIAAAKRINGKAMVPEVAIYFEYALYRANRTVKVSASHFEAFRSPNYPLLAEAGVDIKYHRFAIRNAEKHDFSYRWQMEDRIASLRIFPGMCRSHLEAIVNIPDLKGLVIETFGSGNTPQFSWLTELLKGAIEKGVIVLNITQCHTGSVNQEKYKTGQHLQEIGVLSGDDMTFEAAITKMAYVLAFDGLSNNKKQEILATNLRGEMAETP